MQIQLMRKTNELRAKFMSRSFVLEFPAINVHDVPVDMSVALPWSRV